MILQRTLLPELLGAVGTVVGLLSSMDLHVIIERGHLPETDVTDLAFVWLLTRMRLDVINQCTLLREETPTDAASKRSIRIVAFQHIYVAHIQASTLHRLIVFAFVVDRRCRCHIAGHHRANCCTAIKEMQQRMMVQLKDVGRCAVQVVGQQTARQLLCAWC